MGDTRAQRVRAASLERRERRKEELRQQILDAAQQLFLEHGYDGLSMRQVAEKIGYTPTTIYLHFEDKDALLFAVVDQAYERFTRDLQVAYDSTRDAQQRLYALTAAYIRFGRQNPEAYQVFFMQRPDFLLKWRTGTKQPRASSLQILQQAVAEAQFAGVVRNGNVEILSDAIWAAMHGAVSLAIVMPKMFATHNVDATFSATIEAVLRGLAPVRGE